MAWPLSRTRPKALRALCWDTRARESFSQARSARAPPVTGSLRHRVDGPTPHDHSPAEAGVRSKRSRRANPVSAHRERNTDDGSAGPRTTSLRWAPATSLPAVPDEPESCLDSRKAPASQATPTRARLHDARGRHARHGRKVEPLSRPPSQGLGLASPDAPRRAAEIGDTRGAFHRLTADVFDSGLTPAIVYDEAASGPVPPDQRSWSDRLAGRSPQFVTSLWRAHGAFFDPRAIRQP